MSDSSELLVEHTNDCGAVGGEDCYCTEGEWLQPPGGYVREATDELSSDAPWCQIQARSAELAGAE
jgi:hypothetical protein